MASLALMVMLIFVFVVVSGPLSLLLHRLNLKILAKITGIFAIAAGAWWCCVAPFPVSIIGGISALCGCKVISKF
jgi:hypothetical protein